VPAPGHLFFGSLVSHDGFPKPLVDVALTENTLGLLDVPIIDGLGEEPKEGTA
jgi:hypothetical protein